MGKNRPRKRSKLLKVAFQCQFLLHCSTGATLRFCGSHSAHGSPLYFPCANTNLRRVTSDGEHCRVETPGEVEEEEVGLVLVDAATADLAATVGGQNHLENIRGISESFEGENHLKINRK